MRWLARSGRVAALLTATILAGAAGPGHALSWKTVVNTGDGVPGTSVKFNSFNQPSIAPENCTVAIRGRARGPGQPPRGVFKRTMCPVRGALREVAGVGDVVPAPNNLAATFNEFPSFPRADLVTATIATRGQSQPVWRYLLPDGTETRVGTAGVYADYYGSLVTAASLLGAVPGFERFSVPGAAPGTRFDQFPGAPSPFGTRWVAFKGNYTDGGVGKTGVFIRNFYSNSRTRPTCLIASSDTRIPNQPLASNVKFGSTAPPSAAWSQVFFLGLDSEAAPTLGGIHVANAQCSGPPALRTLVAIGGSVPGVSGATFNRLGEALSLGNGYVSFWGAWGTETRTITLQCPEDGNRDLIDFCNEQHPDGFTTTVPVNQGIFVARVAASVTAAERIKLVARTGTMFRDFLFWNFSGRPPGTGHGDEDVEEPARWRSSAFHAVSKNGTSGIATAFKAVRTSDGVTGLFTRSLLGRPIRSVALVGDPARSIDPRAPAAAVVTEIGVERDGYRNCQLSINASMLDPVTTEGWAGIYLTHGACALR